MPETIIKLQLFPINEIPSKAGEYLTYGINDKCQIEIRLSYYYHNSGWIFGYYPQSKRFYPEYWSYIPKIPPEPLRGKLRFISFECEFE